MATAEVATQPQERTPRRKPFANFVKRLTNFKHNDQEKKEKSDAKKSTAANVLKHKKSAAPGKNNPYPQSGHLHQPAQDSQPSFPSTRDNESDASLQESAVHCRPGHNSNSNKSGAPTLATNAETVHSDAGHSRAATTTTGAGALSSMGGGANSTFSSPNHSEHSLATTLTTIQSTANPQPPTNGVSGGHAPHNGQSQPNGSMFVHQYPVSPAPSALTASAIPRHLVPDSSHSPMTYNSATADGRLTDNASILTLASSSKRRRRSMDTDASVRALAPSSVFGGSRESLPLSVLSGGQDPSRQSIGGMPGTASAERASVYSSAGLARELHQASDRNSYIRTGDAKSLRSITNIKDDARSISGIESRSQYEGKGAHDVASLRSVDAKSSLLYERGGGGGEAQHARNASIPGSIGTPAYTPSLLRQTSGAGTLNLSRRSSDWGHEVGEKEQHDADGKKQQQD